jgi:hypothetical protein
MKIKIFRSDNGTEFMNYNLTFFSREKEFYTKQRVYILPNKMEYRNEKIDIY